MVVGIDNECRSWRLLRQLQRAGYTVCPQGVQRPTRDEAAARFTDIRYWSEPARGGHFPAREQPEPFASDVVAFFALVRKPRANVLREQGADSAHVRDSRALFCYGDLGHAVPRDKDEVDPRGGRPI